MEHRQNNYAFIDSQNLNLAIQDCGWNLDFQRFSEYIRARFSVSKAFLFVGYVAEYQFLYTYLRTVGYIIVFKPTLVLPGEKVKGNVDAELVLHAMIQFPHYDRAVIVTGDGDFHCLVEYLHTQKKLARLVVPNKYRYSSLLRRFASDITFLNGTREKLERKQKEA